MSMIHQYYLTGQRRSNSATDFFAGKGMKVIRHCFLTVFGGNRNTAQPAFRTMAKCNIPNSVWPVRSGMNNGFIHIYEAVHNKCEEQMLCFVVVVIFIVKIGFLKNRFKKKRRSILV